MRLRLLCQREQTTLFIVMMSALATLIHRYSGAADIVIGTPVANRGFREIEPLVGLFINTVAFRFDLSGDPTFKELLPRVRSDAIEVFSNQDVPFESVLNELAIRREKDRSPLFQVMVAMQPPRAASLSSEIGMDPAVLTPRGSKFDMTLVLWEGEDGDVGGIIEYATDLFDPETIERLFKHFVTLLEGITRDPHQRVSGLPMLSSEELQQAVSGWNETTADSSATLSARVVRRASAAHARRRGRDLPAMRSMTYRELDERANKLAWHLRDLASAPIRSSAFVCNVRWRWWLVFSAFLKAGGAYLPLDPNYPAERLAYITADAHPRT